MQFLVSFFFFFCLVRHGLKLKAILLSQTSGSWYCSCKPFTSQASFPIIYSLASPGNFWPTIETIIRGEFG